MIDIQLLKLIIRSITIVILVIIYCLIWVSLVINWDKFMRTAYAYPCFEAFLGWFYDNWICIHIGVVAFLIVWAWV